jgi:uncharacterized MnhB-related membrane protein
VFLKLFEFNILFLIFLLILLTSMYKLFNKGILYSVSLFGFFIYGFLLILIYLLILNKLQIF